LERDGHVTTFNSFGVDEPVVVGVEIWVVVEFWAGCVFVGYLIAETN
jgi:hypothetical protein